MVINQFLFQRKIEYILGAVLYSVLFAIVGSEKKIIGRANFVSQFVCTDLIYEIIF